MCAERNPPFEVLGLRRLQDKPRGLENQAIERADPLMSLCVQSLPPMQRPQPALPLGGSQWRALVLVSKYRLQGIAERSKQ
jgi:hypothetical protein